MGYCKQAGGTLPTGVLSNSDNSLTEFNKCYIILIYDMAWNLTAMKKLCLLQVCDSSQTSMHFKIIYNAMYVSFSELWTKIDTPFIFSSVKHFPNFTCFRYKNCFIDLLCWNPNLPVWRSVKINPKYEWLNIHVLNSMLSLRPLAFFCSHFAQNWIKISRHVHHWKLKIDFLLCILVHPSSSEYSVNY